MSSFTSVPSMTTRFLRRRVKMFALGSGPPSKARGMPGVLMVPRLPCVLHGTPTAILVR
jgi:hypothetical protein